MGAVRNRPLDPLAHGRRGRTEYGAPLGHQTTECIAIWIMANLFQQGRGRVGMPEPHQRIPAIVRPCATEGDDAVRLRTRRTRPAPCLNNRQNRRDINAALLAYLIDRRISVRYRRRCRTTRVDMDRKYAAQQITYRTDVIP